MTSDREDKTVEEFDILRRLNLNRIRKAAEVLGQVQLGYLLNEERDDIIEAFKKLDKYKGE